jgi:Domain of unknown function (DUF4388)
VVSFRSAALAFGGSLKSLPLATVLQILFSEGKTGVLEIAREQTKSSIFLKRGKIVAASTGQKELRIGQILCDRGLISRQMLRQVLIKARDTKKPVGEVVVSLGFVSPIALKEIVRRQCREAVLDVFLWEEGTFEFQEGPVSFDETMTDPIDPMEIVLEAARRMDEWAVIKKLIPSDTIVFKVSDPARQHGERITLQTDELQLLSLLDGQKTVRDVVREAAREEFDVYKTLYAMATSKLIRATDNSSCPKGKTETEELITLAQIYHDVVVTISRHLEEQLGKEFCTRLVNACKVSVPMASQQILAGYRMGSSAEQNVRETLAMASRLQQGDGAAAALGVAFSQFIGLLLRQETEILGSKQTAQTVGRIHQLLEVVDKYRAGEAKTKLIQGIRQTISQATAEPERRP